jgi:hypothetical protein
VQVKGLADKLGKKLTGNDDYEFGDITKKAATTVHDNAEEVGKELTGDAKYKPGDLTKGAAKEADKAADVLVKESEQLKEAADATGNLLREQIITEDED